MTPTYAPAMVYGSASAMPQLEDTKYVGGVAKLSRRIRHIRETLSVPPLVNEIGELLLRRTLDRFDKGVDPDYLPWKPLEEATIRRRARNPKARGHQLLFEEGGLRAAIKVIRGSAAGLAYVNTGAGLRIGVDDPYQKKKALAHQKGLGHVPIRRFLGIGSKDVKSVDGLLRRRADKAEGPI